MDRQAVLKGVTTGRLSRRNFLALAGALLASAGLPGCKQHSPLRVVVNNSWPGNSILWMTESLGLLDDRQVELFDYSLTGNCLLSGSDSFHAAVLPLQECLRLCCEGMELEVILVLNASIGADAVLVGPNTGVEQARLRIGLENSTTGRLMLTQFLAFHGLSPDAVDEVRVQPDEHQSLWHSGQLDALISYEPHVTQLVRQGVAQVVFSSRHLPDLLFDVLVVTPQAAQARGGAIRHLFEAYFQALAHFYANPMDAGHRIASRLHIPAEDVHQLFRGLFLPDALANYAYLTRKEPHLFDAIHGQYLLLQEQGLELPEQDGIKRMLNPGFLPRHLL